MTEDTAEQQNIFLTEINPDQSKEDYYREKLGGMVPEAFFVLGGGNRRIEEKGGRVWYKTSPYKGAFWNGNAGNGNGQEVKPKAGGAKPRPIAAVELSGFYPNAKIVTMSHRPGTLYQMSEQTTQTQVQPPFADVLASDMERLGLPSERVVKEPESTSTLTEMMEVFKLAAENNWENVAVITNDYQIERAQTIIDMLKDEGKLQGLRDRLGTLFNTREEQEAFMRQWQKLEEAIGKTREKGLNINFISAEDVLRKRNHLYDRMIKGLIETIQYKNVVEGERVGNDNIKAGTYNWAQPTFKEYIMSLESKAFN